MVFFFSPRLWILPEGVGARELSLEEFFFFSFLPLRKRRESFSTSESLSLKREKKENMETKDVGTMVEDGKITDKIAI